jgi:hypothetical protein
VSVWLSDVIAGTLGLRDRRDRGEAQGEHNSLHRTNPTTPDAHRMPRRNGDRFARKSMQRKISPFCRIWPAAPATLPI